MRYALLANPRSNRMLCIEDAQTAQLLQIGIQQRGYLQNVTTEDFQGSDYFDNNFTELTALGNLSRFHDVDKIRAQLEPLVASMSLSSAVLTDARILRQIADHEVLKGDLYIARVDFQKPQGRENEPPKTRFAQFFFTDPAQGAPSIEGDNILLGQKQVKDIGSSNLGFCINNYGKGAPQIEKVGELQITRGELKPFMSQGRYGSSHSNPPGVVLEEMNSDRMAYLTQSFEEELRTQSQNQRQALAYLGL